jgi:hypothetical protein
MPSAIDQRQVIAEALAAFADQPLRRAATRFFNTLGYASERTLNIGSVADFLETFDREESRLERFNPRGSWREVQLIFQLTSADIAKGSSHQLSLLEAAPADLRQIDSYLFLAIDLSPPDEGKPRSRTQLCDLARAINRLFPMPALVLLKESDKLSIAITYRRGHKKDRTKDVVERKVTLIKDVSISRPHPGHLAIIQDFALPTLSAYRGREIRTFADLDNAWRESLSVELLRKRAYEKLADWYFWAREHAQFPPDAPLDAEGKPSLHLIRLLTRVIVCWFVKEKTLPDGRPIIPYELFDPPRIASHDAAEGATTLRRTDDLSIRRLGIALSLRKLESIERFSLKPREWFSLRDNLYRVAESHLLTPERLCDFWPRLSRMLGLVFSNADWKAANRMLTRLIAIKPFFESAELLSLWKENDGQRRVAVFVPWFWEILQDELQKSCLEPPNGNEATRFFKRCREAFGFSGNPSPEQQSLTRFRDLDMDRVGHRERFRRGDERPADFEGAVHRVSDFFEHKLETLPDGFLPWLLPTRPFGEQEASVLWPETILDLSKMRKCLFALRGQSRSAESSKQNEPPGAHLVELSQEFPSHSIRIAITNYLTEESSWRASVRGKSDLSISRLRGLLSLLDDFLRTIQKQSWKEKPLYFCLPELSIPREWIFPVAQFLAQARVSLIAGVEYERKPTNSKELWNTAWLFLRNRELGYPATYVMRQFKQDAAPGEAEELWREGEFQVGSPGERPLPVYRHGGLDFGVLICSEMTDVEHQGRFRGEVDAVFCLEWNRDLDTFSNLIESAAYAIHAFIVQVNNRKHGDSRIRAPAKESHERDIIRIRGGDHDYFAVGTLPIAKLRNFQRATHSDLSEGAPYKPIPSGFHKKNHDRLK